MIDIIITTNEALPRTVLQIALKGLKGIHIIEASTFQSGLKQATHEYVCLINNGLVDSQHFKQNLTVFLDQPKFKKLAMVSTAIADSTLAHRYYGYSLQAEGLTPVEKPSSSKPYALQIGYLPGAILRRSSVEHVAQYLTGSLMQDSYQISIDFWLTGKRCYINPNITYIDLSNDFEEPIAFLKDPWAKHQPMQEIKQMWKQEVI